ncbi:MAG TPA: ABC transporter permease [Gemmatimonadales bacterium]|nr:ABC transporter permease [Gemmatimonadales bacterium]
MDTLLQDLKYALRQCAARPGFTAVAVLTLGLGIGANTAIFSVADGVLVRPLPYHAPDQLVLLAEETKDLPFMVVAYPDYLDWRQRNGVFTELAVYDRYRNMNLTGVGTAERLAVAMTSANLFHLLGVRPTLGRPFLDAEDQQGSERVVILSAGLWQRRFGADSGIVGRQILLDANPYLVVGVMPFSLRFAGGPDVWVPIGPFIDADLLNRDNHPGLIAVGRLRRGINLRRAQDDMHTLAQQLADEYPASNKGVDAQVIPLGETGGVAAARPTIVALVLAVAFVLLLACVNVATLALAAGARRGRELTVRVALGASRRRLVRQLLTEYVLVACAGGIVGALLALWGLAVLRTIGSGFVPRADTIAIDWRAALFTAVISLVAGVGFGLAPALRASRGSLGAALVEGGRGASRAGQLRALRTLIGCEVALSVTLLIGAGLMIRSFLALQAVEPGLDPAGVLVANVGLPAAKYPTDERSRAFFDGLLDRLTAGPEGRAAAIVDPLPYGQGSWQTGITLEGVAEEVPGQNPMVDAAVVSGGYFRTLGIPLLQGRTFTAADGPGSPRVVLVSRALADRYWPGQPPVGRRVHFGPAAATTEQWMTVVGVVGDVRLDLERAPQPELYLPYTQVHGRAFSVVLKGAGDIAGAVAALDPNQPVYGIQPMHARLADVFAARRFRMLVFGVFAAVALALAIAGIYGVMSDLVSQRTRDIGIRLALGAERRSIVGLVLAQALRPTLAGLMAGVVATLGLSRLLAGLVFGVRPADPLTFAAVAALLFGAACVAAWVPARRATRVDPMVALRTE